MGLITIKEVTSKKDETPQEKQMPNEERTEEHVIDGENDETDEPESKKEDDLYCSRISAKLIKMLVKQRSDELYNMNLYSYFANVLDMLGLHMLAKYYDGRSNEEFLHHKWINEFLRSVYMDNSAIEFDKFDQVNRVEADIDCKNIILIFELTMKAELETTNNIFAILEQAKEERSFFTSKWLNDKFLIGEQREEEKTSIKALQIARMDVDWLTKEQSIYDMYFNKKD